MPQIINITATKIEDHDFCRESLVHNGKAR
jgi:hypothetical protein